jgi:hypothetical protein
MEEDDAAVRLALRKGAVRRWLEEEDPSAFDTYLAYVRAERWDEVHKAMAEDNPELGRLTREALAMESLSKTAVIGNWEQEGYTLRSSASVPIHFDRADGGKVPGQLCILLRLSLVAPIEPQLFHLREEIKSLERTSAQFA